MMYGFKKRFIMPVLKGTKTGTIRSLRAGRSRHARPGDRLQLKAGSRFRPFVFADTVCSGLFDIGLIDMGTSAAGVAVFEANDGPEVRTITDAAGLDTFAVADGFADWEDLCRFWKDVHQATSFAGAWIRWKGSEVKPR